MPAAHSVAECIEVLRRAGALREEGGEWYLSKFAVSLAPDGDSAAASACYRLLVREFGSKCLLKDHGRSSNRYPVYVVDLDCILGRARQAPPRRQYSLSDVLEEAGRAFAACPLREIPAVRRAYERAARFLGAVASGRLGGLRERNVLLVGPPGTGKSLVLSLFEHPAAPLFYGATTSPRAIAEYLLGYPAALVRFDELDKASKRTVDALLHVLSDGRLVAADARRRVEVRVDAPFLAAANWDFGLKRSESWSALVDRFVKIPVELDSEDVRVLEEVVRAEIPEVGDRVMRALREGRLSLRAVNLYISLWRAGLRELVECDLSVAEGAPRSSSLHVSLPGGWKKVPGTA
jgi:hypothetical protein